MTECHNNSVINNTIGDCRDWEISMYNSTHNRIINNTLNRTRGRFYYKAALKMVYSDYNKIISNKINVYTWTYDNGIKIIKSNNNQINNNTLNSIMSKYLEC